MGGLPELLTAPWPLTGRHEEVDGVCSAIEDGCPAFFVLGEAGTGKTRLAREVLRRLERDGWVTAGATATESAQARIQRLQRAELFCNDERGMIGQHDAASTDADRPGAPGNIADYDGGRCARDASHVVVFSQPEAAIAPDFGMLGEIQ